jgi:hypothetical protein
LKSAIISTFPAAKEDLHTDDKKMFNLPRLLFEDTLPTKNYIIFEEPEYKDPEETSDEEHDWW